jgi:hypothetical protein
LLGLASGDGWVDDGFAGACAAQAFAATHAVLIRTPVEEWDDREASIAGSLVGELGDGFALLAIRPAEAFERGELAAEALVVASIVANGLADDLAPDDELAPFVEEWRRGGIEVPPFPSGRFARFGLFAEVEELVRAEDSSGERFETDQAQVADRLTSWLKTHRVLLERFDAGSNVQSDKTLRLLGNELGWTRRAIATRAANGAAAGGLVALFVIRLIVRNLALLMFAAPAIRDDRELTLLPHEFILEAVRELGLDEWLPEHRSPSESEP